MSHTQHQDHDSPNDPAAPDGSAEPEVADRLAHTPDGPPPNPAARRLTGRIVVVVGLIGLICAGVLGWLFGGLAAGIAVVAFLLVFFALGAMPALGAGAARVAQEEQIRDEVRQERGG